MDVENKYGTFEIQNELLLLLKEFDDFCVRNNIDYSVSSGTLLGAVRHGGFIPWDDDVDCIFDRSNYIRLKDLINSSPSLTLECATRKSLWIDRIRLNKSDQNGKYIPTIDVFVLDNCPDKPVIANCKMLAIKTLQGMMKSELNFKNYSIIGAISSIVLFLLGRFFSMAVKYRLYSFVQQWGNRTPSKYLKIYNDQYKGLKCSFPTNIMHGTQRMPFETLYVNGFSYYDEYLRIIYGDNYLTPPSEADRVPTHL